VIYLYTRQNRKPSAAGEQTLYFGNINNSDGM